MPARLCCQTLAAFAATVLIACHAQSADAPGRPAFSAEEIKAIVSHGPWPMPAARDATNRVSGQWDAIEFGTRLFFDKRLSEIGRAHV